MHWASVTAVGKDGGCPHREPQWPSLPGAGRLDLASHLALCSPSPTLSAGEEVELPGSGWVSGSSPRGGGAIPRSPSQDLMHPGQLLQPGLSENPSPRRCSSTAQVRKGPGVLRGEPLAPQHPSQGGAPQPLTHVPWGCGPGPRDGVKLSHRQPRHLWGKRRIPSQPCSAARAVVRSCGLCRSCRAVRLAGRPRLGTGGIRSQQSVL